MRRLDELLTGRDPMVKAIALGHQAARAFADLEATNAPLAGVLRRDLITTLRKQIANRRGP